MDHITASELIEILNDCDPDAPVVFVGDGLTHVISIAHIHDVDPYSHPETDMEEFLQANDQVVLLGSEE